MHTWMIRAVLAAGLAGFAWPSAASAQVSELEAKVEASKAKAVEYLLGKIQTKMRIIHGGAANAKKKGEEGTVTDIDAEWSDVVIVTDPATKRNTTKIKVKGQEYDDVKVILPPGWFNVDPIARGGHQLAGAGGASALATLALLAAGVNPQVEKKLEMAIKSVLYMHTAHGSANDPTVKDKGAELQPGCVMTYALGIQASCLEYAMRVYRQGDMNAALRKQMDRFAKILEAGYCKTGGYHYMMGDQSYDLSCSQYGILGLWACARANCELSDKTWTLFNEWLLSIQNRDAGWSYMSTQNTKDTMTEAGLASLYLCLDYLHTRTRGATKPDITPFANNPLLLRTVQAIDRGFENFGRVYKPNNSGYYMYGAERIGVASGYKYFGTHDWFREGVPVVLRSQGGDGSWGRGPNALTETSWHLLFLVFGGAPVVVNKLAHGPKGDMQVWNNYPRDAANLAGWYTRNYETLVNWQVLDITTAKVEGDLMDAPILYISGYKALEFTDEEVDKLRRYVERGGTLLFVACGGRREFTDSAVKLGERIYTPERYPEYQFTEMPKEHPVYTMTASAGKLNPLSKLPVWHMSNGTRSFAFLVPEDINHTWHGNRTATAQTKVNFDFFANLKNYCTDKGFLPSKLRPEITAGEAKGNAGAGQIKVAVLSYTSKGIVHMQKSAGKGALVPVAVKNDWASAPLAWRIFGEWFKHVTGSDIQETRGIGLTDPTLKDYDVLHFNGHYGFVLTDEEKKALQGFIEKGGAVIIEPAGGTSTEFYQSALELMRSMFPDRVEGINRSHPIINGTGAAGRDTGEGGFSRQVKISMPELRSPADKIKGVTVNGRVAVLLSPLDLSLGLAGQTCWERLGFGTKTSRALVANFLIYSKKAKAAPVAAADAGGAAPAKAPGAAPAAVNAPGAAPANPGGGK